MLTLPGTSRTHSGARGSAGGRKSDRVRRPLHAHWFAWVGDDAFSGSSLYACRCGMVRPGL